MHAPISMLAIKRLLAGDYTHNEPIRPRDKVAIGGWLAIRALLTTDMLTWSAALAYTFVFSLIPLVATTLAFFTAFPTLQNQRAHLLDFLSQQLLPGAVQGVRGYLEHFSARAATAGTISSITFLITNLLLFQSIETAFNRIWQVKSGRSWSRRFSALAVFFVIGMVGATLLFVVSSFLGGSPSIAFLQSVSSLVVAWTIFVILNKVLPNTDVRWTSAFVGGIFAGTIWHFSKTGFTWYIQTFASYTSIYGTLSTVPVFFLWIYLTFVLMMLGAHTSFVAQNLRNLILEEQGRTELQTSAFFRVAVCAVLGRAFLGSEGPLSIGEISRRLSVSDYFIETALHELCDANIARGLGDDRNPEFILIRPIESLPLHSVIFAGATSALDLPALPPGAKPSPLYRALERLFTIAQSGQHDLFGSLTIRDIVADSSIRGLTAA